MKCCIDSEDLELSCHVILSIVLTKPITKLGFLQSCDILCCIGCFNRLPVWSSSSHVIHYVVLVALTDYQYGVRLVSGVNNKVLITLNARNDHDRQKFVEDLREAILEVIKTDLKRLNFVLIVLDLC